MMKMLPMLALLVVAAACGPGELGVECEAQNDGNPCAEGLLCIPTQREQPDANGDLKCVDNGAFCSVTCDGDGDCTASLGEGHICVNECGVGACFVGSRG